MAGVVKLGGALQASAQGSASVSANASASVSGNGKVNVAAAANVNATASVSAKGTVSASAAVSVNANASVKANGKVEKKSNSSRSPDPAQVALFRVELDGITEAEFLECSGLKNSTDVVEYYEGGENTYMHKFIGNTKYPNIVLKKGVTANSKLIWDWRNAITSNQKPLFKNGAIILLNDRLQEICRWNFKNGWPCRWDGPELKGGTNALSVEVLEIAHDGFSVVSDKMDSAF